MSNELREAKILSAAIKYADKKIAELAEAVAAAADDALAFAIAFG